MYARLTRTKLRATPPSSITPSFSFLFQSPQPLRRHPNPAPSHPSPLLPFFPRNFRPVATCTTTHITSASEESYINVKLGIKMNVEWSESESARIRRWRSMHFPWKCHPNTINVSSNALESVYWSMCIMIHGITILHTQRVGFFLAVIWEKNLTPYNANTILTLTPYGYIWPNLNTNRNLI